ncbi:MAG: GTPase HflX [Brevinematales bacterium]|nr:GTPase HflX [Brevinematales bacterium]
MNEKAVLVGLKLPQDNFNDIQESMLELKRLADTAGAEVVDILIQAKSAIDGRFYIGKGKIEEIREFYADEKVDLVVFNHELSPAQVRNIEKELECRVLTRTELILDIFAIHARTRAAKMQVELAQLKYQLPRLVGHYQNLSRTDGGIGLRGPGEQKLEVDRRILRKKIHIIETKLIEIEREKDTQRKKRMGEFKVSIIGYTNSGKSTLLNKISKSDVLAEDKLFSTLDTTTRRVWLGDGSIALMSDTVGFIRDIPVGLIESFKSTLADARYADMLLHVADVSDPALAEHIRSVNQTLKEIGADHKPTLLCLNKIDLLPREILVDIRLRYPGAIFVSAKEGQYTGDLKNKLIEMMKGTKVIKEQGEPEHE